MLGLHRSHVLAVLEPLARALLPGSAPLEPGTRFERVLVVRGGDLGDVILATPLLRALRAGLPGARIEVLVGPWAEPVLRGNPNVDALVVRELPWGTRRANPGGGVARSLRFVLRDALARELGGRGYDLALDVAGHLFTAVLLARARVRRRVGVRGYAGGASLMGASIPFDPNARVAEAALGLARLLGVETAGARPEIVLDDSDRGECARLLEARSLDGARLLAVAPGAGWPPSKRWPAERFGRAAALVAREAGLRVVICGTAEERPLAERVRREAPEAADACGALSLRAFASLVERSALVLANNSAAVHLAACFRTPVVAVTMPSSGTRAEQEAQWAPPDRFAFVGPEETGARARRAVEPYPEYEAAAAGAEEVARAALALLPAGGGAP